MKNRLADMEVLHTYRQTVMAKQMSAFLQILFANNPKHFILRSFIIKSTLQQILLV